MTFESLPKLRAATSLGFTRHLPSPNLGPDCKTRRDGELLFEALTGVVPGEVRAGSPDPFLTTGKRGRGSPKDGTRTGVGHPRAAFSDALEIQNGRASKLGAGKGLVNSSPITAPSSPGGVRTVENQSDGWDVLVKGRDGKRQPATSAPGSADQTLGNGASEIATRSEIEGDVTRAAQPPPVADVSSKPASRGGVSDSRKRPSGSPPTGGRKRSSGRARARPAGVQTEVSETEESDDGFVFGSYESFFYQASTWPCSVSILELEEMHGRFVMQFSDWWCHGGWRP
jgi:hypothetical protein